MNGTEKEMRRRKDIKGRKKGVDGEDTCSSYAMSLMLCLERTS